MTHSVTLFFGELGKCLTIKIKKKNSPHKTLSLVDEKEDPTASLRKVNIISVNKWTGSCPEYSILNSSWSDKAHTQPFTDTKLIHSSEKIIFNDFFFKSSFFSIEWNRCWEVSGEWVINLVLKCWMDSLLVRIDSWGEKPVCPSVFPYLSDFHLNIFIIKGFHLPCQSSWLTPDI